MIKALGAEVESWRLSARIWAHTRLRTITDAVSLKVLVDVVLIALFAHLVFVLHSRYPWLLYITLLQINDYYASVL